MLFILGSKGCYEVIENPGQKPGPAAPPNPGQQGKERLVSKISKRKKLITRVLSVFLILFSTSAFACFICEESIQTVNFGAFMYSNAKDYEGMAHHLENQEQVHKIASGIIHGIGWLNPLMYPSYLAFLKANRGYLDSITQVVQERLASNQSQQQTTVNAGASQAAQTNATSGCPNGTPVCKYCHSCEHMEYITWLDKETGDPKSGWLCQACDKWYWP
jgi:hypothetical protein